MALSWNEQLQNALIKQHGNKKGALLDKKYARGFSPSYKDDYHASTALTDIEVMEQLSDQNPLQLNIYTGSDQATDPLHLRLFQWQQSIPLCDIMPILENLNLRAYEEFPHKINLEHNQSIWISDFVVKYPHPDLDIKRIKPLFIDAFKAIYLGKSENDGFNKLVLAASLSWQEIVILRAYTKYLRQVAFRFSQIYIENTLLKQAEITRSLVELFMVMHDPRRQAQAKKAIPEIEQQILRALEKVSSLDEDRIVRRILDLIKATLRTNYFQTTPQNSCKDYVSIKLASHAVPELPLPVPLYEIFVYANRFEGIHLRSTPVARGGIRWSDRREDFRTEILGLMKAQKVKNAVIVPSGAKGGFVLKKSTHLRSREEMQREVVHCYQSFIRGLLDITDNIKDKRFIRPKNCVCYDDIDPYLVVAADKGTASFSDMANAISREYDFWLDDAFASGGSEGYDHKKIGITARGAWESIKRHFREINIDAKANPISVIGIGDMSGDVFGNGLIYSKHLQLVGAFDHRHIFLDPTPDPETSYYERLRLFNLASSSWEDYNPKLISKGGGVFKRSLKSITLTPAIKKVLGTEESSLTPTELIKVMLRAPVDLLFNGGIGTYVKASTESNTDVGDRTNDYCRINGGELRCKIVGEGGNLGFTQLGRVEYALNGGLINTDFIDNSAGVDCSDHEVNLKILLNNEVQCKRLTNNKRNQLLASLTQEVADLVLHDNYAQALVMSYSAYHAKKNIGLHTDYIKDLETLGVLDRQVEFLPDEKKLIERKAAGIGLTRPELAVLLAYTKINLKNEILKTNLPEDPFLSQTLITAFPASILKKYNKAMREHKLHREIIATQLSNIIVNDMGITFVYRLQVETGSTIEEIIRAHAIASHIFGTLKIQKLIESFNFKIPMSDQHQMLYNIRHLINLSTRWFLHSHYLRNDLQQTIEHFTPCVEKLEPLVPTLMSGATKRYLDKLTAEFQNAGLPKESAKRIGTYRGIYTALNVIDIATLYKFDLVKTAKVYFKAGEQMNLVWFRDELANDAREGHWNALARLTLRDELDIAQRALTIAIMQNDTVKMDAARLINEWFAHNQRAVERWDRILAMLHTSSSLEYTMFFIAIRELMGLLATSLALPKK